MNMEILELSNSQIPKQFSNSSSQIFLYYQPIIFTKGELYFKRPARNSLFSPTIPRAKKKIREIKWKKIKVYMGKYEFFLALFIKCKYK